jgi:hypothetical protein
MFNRLAHWFVRLGLPKPLRSFFSVVAILWVAYSLIGILLIYAGFYLGFYNTPPSAERLLTGILVLVPIIVTFDAAVEFALNVNAIRRIFTTALYCYFSASAAFTVFTFVAFATKNQPMIEISKKVFRILFGGLVKHPPT